VAEARDLLDPRRSASASIRGYLYQIALGVLRWLELNDAEVLVCEGDEDLDRYLSDEVRNEQVKHYGGSLGINDRPVRESLRNFLRAFVTFARRGDRHRYVFTTTARRRGARKGEKDLLREWPDPARRARVVTRIRRLVAAESEALEWLNAADDRWNAFIGAVEWRFEQPGIEETRREIRDRLARRCPDLPAEVVEARLIVEVFETSSHDLLGLRQLDKARLDGLLGRSREELQGWATSYNLVWLRASLSEVIATELDAHASRREMKELRSLLDSGVERLRDGLQVSNLLSAGSQAVQFRGRDKLLGELGSWWSSNEAAALQIVHGDGGAGKTRLMVEWIAQLRRQREIAGFVRDHAGPGDAATLLGGVGRRLLVIDYAETRLALVEALLGRMVEANAGRPVRLLLLTRNLGEWWEREAQVSRRFFLEHQPVARELPALVPGIVERGALFDEALHGFARIRGVTRPAVTVPDLSAPEFSQPLYVLMAASAALDGKVVTDAAGLLKETVAHERRYWNRGIKDLGLTRAAAQFMERAVERAVTMVTLLGAVQTRDDAHALLRRDPLLTNEPAVTIETLLEFLRVLYPGGESKGSAWVRGLAPDLLGEQLVEETLTADDSVLNVVLDGAPT
jgi:hypothetical protein